MDVALKAPALEVVTYTVNLEEAASGIAVTLPDLNFSLAVLLNLPNPRPILPGYSAYSIKRFGLLLLSIGVKKFIAIFSKLSKTP